MVLPSKSIVRIFCEQARKFYKTTSTPHNRYTTYEVNADG
jgi:hypothetical protein